MKKYLFLLLGGLFPALEICAQTLPEIQAASFRKDTFNITRYGANADGLTLNTTSINEAIIACNKAGGGVVLVPKGLWLTGPLQLRSNVNLCVEEGALLQFTADKNQYKLVEGNFEGLPAYRNQSPLYATDAENIGVTGKGIIDGNGSAWRAVNHDRVSEMEWNALLISGGVVSKDSTLWYPSENYYKGSLVKQPGLIIPGKDLSDYAEIKDFLRPNLLVFTRCKKVLLEGVTFQNSPAWCLHPLMCENVTIRNIYVKNPWYAQNGDGVDVESCSNVLIEGSTFDVGDDGICIKSGRNEAGRKRNMPTKNVIVRKCVVYHAHGGFVIGSEMSGGAKDIYVSDCTFIGTDIGLRFKTTRGRGGTVERINISNIYMKDILNEAILFDMYYFAAPPTVIDGAPQVDFKPVTEETPVFKDFNIENVVCNGAAKAIFIRGLPEMHIAAITLSNITVKSDKGIECSEASGIKFSNVYLVTKESSPVVDILNSDLIIIDSVSYNSNADLLLKISGSRSKDIRLVNTDTYKAKKVTEFKAGAHAGSLVKE